MEMGSRSRVEAELFARERYLLLTHVRPDGDAIGSLLALALALEGMGKSVRPLCKDGVPGYLSFLPGADRVVTILPDNAAYDVVVYLDCGAEDRAGDEFLPARFPDSLIISIDHHLQENPFGHVFWIDSRASSTCEMLYHIFSDCGVSLTPDIATCLYTGISTDTGSFQYSNTNERVLRIAADLAAAGADPYYVSTQVYESASPARLLLLGRVLNTLSYHGGKAVAVARLTQKMIREVGADSDDSEGFVNMLRQVKPVKVAVLIKEDEEGGVVRVSLRSKNSYDVAAFSRCFGGGGHVNAAAFEMRGAIEDVERKVIKELCGFFGFDNPGHKEGGGT
ncbi:DHH family phosphoesterase [Thermodesulforhabdus norvegica]|uniref:Phosphoesterase RecJ domain-containing protein n=1 Tax=Thermodesulforhabdus norvegica TaxID=39841 RepID=A0A1I4VLC5_9BACT|nr:bifunctional oligoribonuclease/PAP phosphatase NrnA [Thermodesulforhabdus norvegica]SFN02062.1 phosphoesterase RecJ domain-containing protein [Thermodesulforhabdus norvegica]